MAYFEIRVNGDRRFVGDDVRALTLVTDWVARRNADRVSMHVGVGEAGEQEVHYLGADLKPGDEITIRVLESDAVADDDERLAPSCSFCGSDMYRVRSLVSGGDTAICDACLAAFDDVLRRSAPLPLGASFGREGEGTCGFCLKSAPEIPGLLVRNGAAICPECLRGIVDMTDE